MSAKSGVAEFDRFRIQVQAADLETPFGQCVQQSSGTACRLEQPLRFTLHESLAATDDELCLGGTIGPKDEVVVLGVIVDRFVNDFDRVGLQQLVSRQIDWLRSVRLVGFG